MKTLTLLTAAAAVALTAAVAHAQPGHRGPGGHGGPGGQGGAHQAMMTLRAADANSDGTITSAEVETLQAEMFAYMDRNGDGFLDQADASPVRQRLRAVAEAEGHEGRRGRGRRGGPEREVDADQDGRISYAEFMGRENRLFNHLDANTDGQITPDELDAAVERRENRGR
jgi:hypothetical protein